MKTPRLFVLGSVVALLTQCYRGPAEKVSTQQTAHSMKKMSQSQDPQALALAGETDLKTLITEVTSTLLSEQNSAEAEASAVTDLAIKTKYVKFSDVKSWKAVAPNYAAGYDEKGKLLAMYDLTYQNTLSPEFIGRSILGTIGAGDLNLREVVRLIRKAIQNRKNQDADLLAQTGEMAPGAYTEDEYGKMESALDGIEAKYGDQSTPFKGEWAKSIPLKKSSTLKMSGSTPTYFKLSDIDLSRIQSRGEKKTTAKALAKISDITEQMLDLNSEKILEELAIQRNAEGTYDLVLATSSSSKTNLFANEQPMKVIDFVRYKNNFGYSLLRLALKSAIGQIRSAIPEPTTAALIGYAISRWFTLHDMQQSFHRYRAYEYIVAAERNENSPFNFLTATQRMEAGVYVQSHEASIFTELFKPRNEASWRKSLANETAMVEKNTRWAASHNLDLTPFASNFAYGDKTSTEGTDFLLSLGARPRFVQKPIVDVNYLHPYNERIKRNILIIVDQVTSAISIGIPGANFLIHILYDAFVMNDLKNSALWDARLASVLMNQQGDYSKELKIIYDQRVNPFEFKLDEEANFVQRSRHYLGL